VTPPGARFHDRRALFVWIAAAVWDAGAALLAWILFGTETSASSTARLAVLGIATATALGFTAWALVQPVVTIDVMPGGGLTITRRAPLWLRREVLPASDAHGATVIEENFGDSGAYYVARVELRNRPPIDLLSDRRRDRVEAAVARFNRRR
jgi:hypothetical protein